MTDQAIARDARARAINADICRLLRERDELDREAHVSLRLRTDGLERPPFTRHELLRNAHTALRTAALRVRMANAEGNPILSAWLPDAEAVIRDIDVFLD